MDIFDLSAKITLDTSGAEMGVASFGTKLRHGVGQAVKAVGVAIGAATAAIGAFAVSSIKTGAEFDKAMSQVGATMLKTTDEMAQEVGKVDTAYGTFEGNLREFSMFLGRNTAFSATEAAEALNYMALAGYSTQESMEMLPNVLSLAAAGGFDLARASDMVTDTQTAFGLSAERTAQMVDEMAKAASTGNTSVEQLGDAFLTVGGLAKELNGGFVTLADGTQAPVDGVQELEIALTAMANAGFKGSEAGTHIRNMLLKLSSPTAEGTRQLEELGVAVFDDAGQMRSLSSILGDLNSSLGDLTQQEKIQAISELFNTRDMASAEALLAAIGDDWNEIGEAILDAKGAADEMAKIQLDNLAGDVTLFKSALEVAKITISDVLSPALREFVQFGTAAISDLEEAFSENGLTGAMDELGRILSDGLSLVFKNLPGIAEGAIALISSFGSGIINNLPLLVDTGFEIAKSLLDYILQGLSGDDSSFVDMIVEMGQKIVEHLGEIMTVGSEIMVQLGQSLSQALPELIPAIVEIITTLIETLTNPDNIVATAEAALAILLALFDGIIAAIPVLLQSAPVIVDNLVTALLKLVPLIIEAGVQLLSALVDNIDPIIEAYVDALPEIISRLVIAILDNAPDIAEAGVMLFIALVSLLPQIIIGIVKAIPDIVKGIVDGFRERWPDIKQAGVDAFTRIKDGIVEKVHQAAEWGRDLMNNFISGIRDKIETLKATVSNVASSVKSFIGFSEPEEGPLSNFHTYAPDMMTLFAQGIRDNEDIVRDQLEKSLNFDDVFHAEYNVSGGSSRAESTLVREIKALRDDVRNMKVYLDTGVLVGAVDSGLGMTQAAKNRRVIA